MSTSPTARTAQSLAAALSLHSRGELAEAERLYRDVLAAQPANPDALHMLGVIECARGNPAAGATLIARAAAASRPHPMLARNLASAHAARGARTEALAVLDEAVRRWPADPVLALLRADALLALERFDASATQYDAALRLDATSAAAAAGRIRARLRAGRVAEAVECAHVARRLPHTTADLCLAAAAAHTEAAHYVDAAGCIAAALAFDPHDVATLLAAGAWHAEYGDRSAAERLLSECVRKTPADPAPRRRLAALLSALGRDAEAATLLRPIADAPEADAATCLECGVALASSSDFAAAGPYVRRALLLAPESAGVALVAGRFHSARREHSEALDCFRRAASLDPASVEARAQATFAGLMLGEWDDWTRHARALASLAPDDACWPSWAANPFILLALPASAMAQRRAAEAYVTATAGGTSVNRAMSGVAASASAPAHSRPHARGDRRLRVGYLSADFRRHPVGKLVAHTLAAHDRNGFEIVGLSVGRSAPDGRSDRRKIVEACDRFVEIEGGTDAEIAARIAAEQIDVVVDLGGHTAASRLSALRARPAPVQIAWLGYAGTTGASFVDYYVADRTCAPDVSEFTEQLIRLPQPCLPPDPDRRAAAPRPRAELGLPDDAVVFASFNQLLKINPDVFAVWMGVLVEVPNGVLWLGRIGPAAQDRLRAAAAAHGVDPARIVFADTVDDDTEHFARYRVADVALDTFPYGSHTTAADALWLGCPLVTLRGQTLAGRIGASLLENAGLGELVGGSRGEFVSIAVALARDPVRRAALRRRLELHHASQAASPRRFAAQLEFAYRAAFDRCASGHAPLDINVPDGAT